MEELVIQTRSTHTERIVLKVEPPFKERAGKAAEVRDGGNISRFIRRAVDRLIEEERLLESDHQEAA